MKRLIIIVAVMLLGVSITAWYVALPPACPEPTPTNTPELPTDTPEVPTATNTPELSTDTPEPTATNTPEVPTDTPEPTSTSTPELPTVTPTGTLEPTPTETPVVITPTDVPQATSTPEELPPTGDDASQVSSWKIGEYTWAGHADGAFAVVLTMRVGDVFSFDGKIYRVWARVVVNPYATQMVDRPGYDLELVTCTDRNKYGVWEHRLFILAIEESE